MRYTGSLNDDLENLENLDRMIPSRKCRMIWSRIFYFSLLNIFFNEIRIGTSMDCIYNSMNKITRLEIIIPVSSELVAGIIIQN